jgi:ketosteroid isomerase-like protein
MHPDSIRSILLVAALALTTQAFAHEDDAALIKRQSQEFSDASASADAKIIEKYLDDDVIFMDESGSISSKHDIVAGLSPPAEGISNKLVQSDWQIKIQGNVAVTSFADNSTMSIYGQSYQARYLSTEVWLKKAGAWRMISSQTLALPADPPAIHLPNDLLDQYAGTYEAGPKLIVRIERKDDGLASTTNGGKTNPLLAEVRDVLFTPGQPRVRRIFERDAAGKITGFIARHEGHDLRFKRTA